MCCITGQTFGTTATIFQNIDDVLTKLQFPWSNCLGFLLDNTSASLGVLNSIKTKVILKNKNCYFTGCPFHIIHNTAKKGSVEFNRVTKFDTEDFCLEIYFYLGKSAKQKNALQSYAEFCGQEYRTFLEHVELRWLSLERAVERILFQYATFKIYFESEDAPKSTTNADGLEFEWVGDLRD